MVNVLLQGRITPFDETKMLDLVFAESLVENNSVDNNLIREIVSAYVVR